MTYTGFGRFSNMFFTGPLTWKVKKFSHYYYSLRLFFRGATDPTYCKLASVEEAVI